jgi:hypothetical protein
MIRKDIASVINEWKYIFMPILVYGYITTSINSCKMQQIIVKFLANNVKKK